MSTQLIARSIAGATLACGYLWARATRSRATLHELVAAHSGAVARYPGLCEACSAFAQLGDDEATKRLMALVAQVHDHDVARSGASQWHIARHASDIPRVARGILDEQARKCTDQDRFRELAHLREDVVPDMERHLESVLHNHMLGE